jgi:hypothetical protein
MPLASLSSEAPSRNSGNNHSRRLLAAGCSFVRNDPSETAHVIDQLKEEIRQLCEKQSQAVESAKYIGLSREEEDEDKEEEVR